MNDNFSSQTLRRKTKIFATGEESLPPFGVQREHFIRYGRANDRLAHPRASRSNLQHSLSLQHLAWPPTKPYRGDQPHTNPQQTCVNTQIPLDIASYKLYYVNL
jgi:hypothetical protein